MNTDTEEWRQIADFLDYSISNHGRIRRDTPSKLKKGFRATPGKIMKQKNARGGYLKFGGVVGGKFKSFYVHRLVAKAFLPPPDNPERTVVAHNDGDCKNNKASNLRWASPLENSQDTIKHGTQQHGERSVHAKLNDISVIEIREKIASGAVLQRLAEEYGVMASTISSIKHRRYWKHIA